jgi:hypothetical protein
MMFLLMLCATIAAQAAPISRADDAARLSLYGGLGALAAPGAPGGGVSGQLAWRGHPRVGLHLGAREVVLGAPLRTIGLLDISARFPLGPGLAAHVGFAHAHETPWAEALAHPLPAIFGTLSGITHRSGLQAGIQQDWTIDALPWAGVYAGAQLTWLADSGGPHFYGGVELGVAIHLPGSR